MTDRRWVRRADDVIREFFEWQGRRETGRRLERLQRAEADLRECLRAHAADVFVQPELELLELERQFDPVGAPDRVAGAEVALLVLPMFLGEPRWHGVDREDRRTRIRIAGALCGYGLRLPELADYWHSCEHHTIGAAIEAAHGRLRQEEAAVRRA